MIPFYLIQNALNITESQVELAYSELEKYLSDDVDSVDATWSYSIPELGDEGTCSLFGHLQEKPFELSTYLKNNRDNDTLLRKLQIVVEFIKQKTEIDWFGIYTNIESEDGPQLLKLAYYGAPSRPLFPISEYFAANSNNTRVYMSEKGCVINDVEKYVQQGGEYYTCDPNIKSECCLPIFNIKKQCVGIIDAESFETNYFTDDVLAILVAACLHINQILP